MGLHSDVIFVEENKNCGDVCKDDPYSKDDQHSTLDMTQKLNKIKWWTSSVWDMNTKNLTDISLE